MKILNHSQEIHEVQVHYKRPLLSDMKSVSDSQSAYSMFQEIINENTLDLKEFFWAMYLTNMNKILAIAEIAVGTTNGVVVNNKEILQTALMLNASNIILAHNHPSGNLKFSQKDINVTKKLQLLAEVLDMSILDHLVITSEGYISMEDEGQIQL